MPITIKIALHGTQVGPENDAHTSNNRRTKVPRGELVILTIPPEFVEGTITFDDASPVMRLGFVLARQENATAAMPIAPAMVTPRIRVEREIGMDASRERTIHKQVGERCIGEKTIHRRRDGCPSLVHDARRRLAADAVTEETPA